jgi:uncharacterized protein YciI
MRHFFCTIHKTPKRATVTDEVAFGVLTNHTAYFKELAAQGKCVVAGPFVDHGTAMGGGCYILAVDSENEARALADADPLVSEGLYDYKIFEWTRVV